MYSIVSIMLSTLVNISMANAIGSGLPELPVEVELVSDGVKQRTIHGWHSSRLVMYDGHLYAAATVQDDNGDNAWQDKGILFRRESDGKWRKVGELPNQPYHICVAPDGHFWVIAPSRYRTCEVYRSKRPGDLSDMEIVYNGTCAYVGASISPEGNFLVMHAEANDAGPNAVITKFYKASTDTWYTSRFETPEHRCGYEGIILRGKKAIAVVNSSACPPVEGATINESSPWRKVRLARCDDLTKGQWTTRMWLDRDYGATGLADIYFHDDSIYLTYSHRGADSPEEYSSSQSGNFIARISDDLSVEVYPFPQSVGAGRILRSLSGKFYFLGRSGSDLSLWDMDVENSFGLSNERRLVGLGDKLAGYVMHTLRPQRFGGEDDGDTIHLLNTTTSSEDPNNEKLYHASFRLPE